MTLQKAMRVRADLKKEIVNLNELIREYPRQISFKDNVPSDEELAAKRAEKSVALDGMSYDEVLKKMFSLTDAIQDLNIAIEKANRDGHNLLFKESAIKSKLSMVDYQISLERNITPESESLDYDYEHQDEKGNYKRVKVKTYNFPLLTDETFSMSLIAYKKKLAKDLEEVRDMIIATALRKIVNTWNNFLAVTFCKSLFHKLFYGTRSQTPPCFRSLFA